MPVLAAMPACQEQGRWRHRFWSGFSRLIGPAFSSQWVWLWPGLVTAAPRPWGHLPGHSVGGADRMSTERWPIFRVYSLLPWGHFGRISSLLLAFIRLAVVQGISALPPSPVVTCGLPTPPTYAYEKLGRRVSPGYSSAAGWCLGRVHAVAAPPWPPRRGFKRSRSPLLLVLGLPDAHVIRLFRGDSRGLKLGPSALQRPFFAPGSSMRRARVWAGPPPRSSRSFNPSRPSLPSDVSTSHTLWRLRHSRQLQKTSPWPLARLGSLPLAFPASLARLPPLRSEVSPLPSSSVGVGHFCASTPRIRTSGPSGGARSGDQFQWSPGASLPGSVSPLGLPCLYAPSFS